MSMTTERTARLADLFLHLVGHKTYAGYVIALVDGRTWSITCLACGLTSFNLTDVTVKYCGACHVFHEDQQKTDDLQSRSGASDPVNPETTQRKGE